MRTLVVTEFVSLDGVVEAPGGEAGYRHAGWTFDLEQDPVMYEFKLAEQLEADILLLGRATYDGFSGAWPERDGEFADKVNSMPKYVVSTTLSEPAWENTTVLADVGAVRALKEDGEGTILVAGSASLVHALQREGLVDQWNLLVFPVVLGSGLRLWADDVEDKLPLELTEHRSYANGVCLQVYRRA